MSSFRFAHISDIHYSKISFGASQFFSKRWIGNLNFLLRRKREFDYSLLEELIPVLVQEKIETVLISGDLSCTSLEEEFLKASSFVKALKQNGIETIILPGNHDHYTKKSYQKKTFYHFFPSKSANSPNLKLDQLEITKLNDSWHLIALDTTLATPLFCSHGRFDEKIEKTLEKALSSLPSDAQVIIANHFPIALEKSALQRESHLISLLQKYPKVKLYLHGHTHKRKITDHRSNNLPIVVDSGSASHRFIGSWNVIECKEKGCSIKPFTWKKTHWTPEKEVPFTW